MQEFTSMFVLFFAIFGLIDGFYMTWQGRGRPRGLGIVLLILAILCLVTFIDATWGLFGVIEQFGVFGAFGIESWGMGPVWTGVKSLIGALVGLLIPTIFLIVAMLS